jgi:hypothetical protein
VAPIPHGADACGPSRRYAATLHVSGHAWCSGRSGESRLPRSAGVAIPLHIPGRWLTLAGVPFRAAGRAERAPIPRPAARCGLISRYTATAQVRAAGWCNGRYGMQRFAQVSGCCAGVTGFRDVRYASPVRPPQVRNLRNLRNRAGQRPGKGSGRRPRFRNLRNVGPGGLPRPGRPPQVRNLRNLRNRAGQSPGEGSGGDSGSGTSGTSLAGCSWRPGWSRLSSSRLSAARVASSGTSV